jgi:hypothetical protein
MARSLAVAQHEAAHIVVGVALGLRLREAVLGAIDRPDWQGYALFTGANRAAWALTLAAGVAWDDELHEHYSSGDVRLLRRLSYRGGAIDALALAAGAILETRGVAHARVTRALLERDLRAADVAAIARGERIDADD